MNVITSITVLGLLIFFHESGHFIAAIAQGIRVNGFSIGFGPAIIKKEIGGITYSLRALPLGGFVSFPDDDKDKEIPDNDPDLLKNRPIIQRLIVISAGVIANLLLAWLVLLSQATFIGLPNQPDPGVLVMSVQANEAASTSGIKSGDKIFAIDDQEIGKGNEAVQLFVKKIKEAPNEKLKISFTRNEEEKIIFLTPSEFSGEGKIGAQLQANVKKDLRKANSIDQVINYSNNQFFDILVRTIDGYKSLITNFNSTASQLSGPVKIVEIGAQLSQEGGSGLILFAALVSINLAVLNSLPLPLLDGGQFALLILEGIRGKPIPERIQLVFMQSGFFLLVGLSVILIIRDTTQLSMVQQLINH